MSIFTKIKNRLLFCLIPHGKWIWEFFNNLKKFEGKKSVEKIIFSFNKGFYIDSIELCKINRKNYSNFLSDKIYNKIHPINGVYSSIIDNKLYLPFLFKDYPEIIPKYFYFLSNGRKIILSKDLSKDTGFLDLLKQQNKLVLKHCYSSLGEGFYLLEYNSSRYYVNKKEISIEELEKLIQSLNDYICTEYIKQHKYANEIYSKSSNTVRLLLLWNSEVNSFIIANSFHRFGMQNKLVDNIGNGGGILYYIDTVSGKLRGHGLLKYYNKPIDLHNNFYHPETETRVEGIQIPNWNNIIEKIISVMNNLSFLKYVGIDIIITDNGFKIIELNSHPTLAPLQVEKGIWESEPLKKFFSEIIK
ncbi:sugar-transfer associated ATP-grasp domain-containing protein [Ignavibacterium sp.]|uniref:sugar-transfer associated ATP-grasp domain-containing protein n=1 Tax=Ignavibacterium sp. TaxID=2651167 RepID=UPI0021FE5C0B|nr:sugar-transfer associated ATP-grasp domain-containing protein [Ignavibacterium sp.]BDQ02779.1 MAG: hypothetical protein KatS3mg037_1354 [Ignavibacterium sp.]